MDETKNVSVLEEFDKKIPEFIPSVKEMEVVSSVFLKFTNSATQRNMGFENFDGDRLIDYIEDSVRRYITNVDLRDDIEDWQARVHDPFTRNKVTAILGKIVQVLPIAEFKGRGLEDTRKGKILTDLYLYSEELDDYEQLIIDILQEAIVKGTAIGYEGQNTKKQKVRTVKNEDDDIKVKNEIKTQNQLFGQVVKLEDFYPSSVGINNIKKMPYCFWRDIIPYQQFLQDYATFKKSVYVQSNMVATGDDNRPYYLDYVSNDVAEGSVEIIRYYNKDVDEFVIIANGVWLNPIQGKTTEIISPLQFNHKELPFWVIRFESFGNDFFYGKSLPDKLKSIQDVLNVLTNMLLDKSFLTIFPPLLTNGFDSIEDDYLRPGRRTPIDTQGLPIRDSFMKLDLGTPSGWHQYILEYTRKIMEESSVDQVSQGVAGVGGRTTAQEIRVAAEGVASMLGLFGRLVKEGVKRKALLRGKNILQFWTRKGSPIMSQVLGEKANKEFDEAFNLIKISDGKMTSGKRGQKIIAMYNERKELPTKGELDAQKAIFKAETGKDIEIIANI